MKSALVFSPMLICTLFASPLVDAQMASRPQVVRTAPAAMTVQSTRTRARQAPARAQDSTPRFQTIAFTFWTGDDDLRDDSVLTAVLAFPDGKRQDCLLHGKQASGAAANISWDNGTVRDAPPCRLYTPRTADELKNTRISIRLFGPGSGPSFGEVLGSGGLAAVSIRSSDEWKMAGVEVKAYNMDGSGESCIRSVRGDPVAKLTGNQPEVTISDFPNQCP